MPKKIVRSAVAVIVVIAWVVMVVSALPVGPTVSDSAGRLALCVAGVGSMEWLFRHLMCPARDVYLAGKMVGRAEVLREQEANVASLEERRVLRVVSKS